jgi:hypothetical protein
MNHPWTALVAIAAIIAAVAPYLVHRHQQATRRTEARLARLQAQYEGDLRAIQAMLACLDRIRVDLHTVLAEGPLCAGRLAALGLAERLERLEAPLKGQMISRAGLDLLYERIHCLLRNPYPGDPAGSEADPASWRDVREAVGRGASQQAAAHAALDSLRALTGELQQRELDLTGKVLTLVGR